MRNFREYEVWQHAMQLVKDVYAISKSFPASEIYALSNQVQRAVVSIPSNIAEGAGRKCDTDFSHFLDIALGSAYEVETQVIIAQSLGYITNEQTQLLLEQLNRIDKELTNFINMLEASSKKGTPRGKGIARRAGGSEADSSRRRKVGGNTAGK